MRLQLQSGMIKLEIVAPGEIFRTYRGLALPPSISKQRCYRGSPERRNVRGDSSLLAFLPIILSYAHCKKLGEAGNDSHKCTSLPL